MEAKTLKNWVIVVIAMSYASILHLRIPSSFRIILRGKDVEHHNIVNDMIMPQEVTYHPQPGTDGVPKDANMVASVTIGCVKDAKAHIDVQGVLEANFVEPAHEKQGFERSTVLARLEAQLIQMQKTLNDTSSSSKMPTMSVDKGHNKCHMYGKEDMKKKASRKRPSSSGSSSSGEDVTYQLQ
ncbi:unnamed protein product [Fraxinus pennsylvanica]|uniref:Morc S5 domain-containing protein n=1 Tax=Fraxinus pennsylvanica TaxID=56036 RepID=A0AAD1ZZJ8_9LAMI|nr:unnamed protein product [Fraxinus pennsylvanica]